MECNYKENILSDSCVMTHGGWDGCKLIIDFENVHGWECEWDKFLEEIEARIGHFLVQCSKIELFKSSEAKFELFKSSEAKFELFKSSEAIFELFWIQFSKIELFWVELTEIELFYSNLSKLHPKYPVPSQLHPLPLHLSSNYRFKNN